MAEDLMNFLFSFLRISIDVVIVRVQTLSLLHGAQTLDHCATQKPSSTFKSGSDFRIV